jgi:hypothetical protein
MEEFVMKATKIVSRRKRPQTPEEFHALGSQLDHELSIVRPFTRKRGFVFKARTWEECADWESRRSIEEHRPALKMAAEAPLLRVCAAVTRLCRTGFGS